MAMSIRSNLASLIAQRNFFNIQNALDDSIAKLSSGYRITRASDDAAGLGVSSNLQAQVRSYNQAARNAADGVSIVQTAEAAMNEQSEILIRLRELATQAASDGVTNTERGYIQNEVDAIVTEFNRIAQATEFNGTKLLNNAATTLTFQVGIRNVIANDRITITAQNTSSSNVGIEGLNMTTKAAAQSDIGTIDTAIQLVSASRAQLGAHANRLNNTINNIKTAAESLAAADSRIRDADIAEETARLARNQVLMQAAVAVLAQANQQSELALKLLS